MQLELDLNIIKQEGKKKEDENLEFRAFLKGEEIEKVNRIVHRLHDKIVAEIDCTKCGNCCNYLRPSVSDKEINRLSGIDKVSPDDFKGMYVELSDDNVNYLKDMPCKYLKEKICTIYPDRPEDCRSYPHTHKDEFISRLFGVLENYEICPIVYNLYEILKNEFDFNT